MCMSKHDVGARNVARMLNPNDIRRRHHAYESNVASPHAPVIRKSSRCAKGFTAAAAKRSIRVAKQAVIRAGQYAYRDRRNKKRVFRALWIARINAAARSTA